MLAFHNAPFASKNLRAIRSVDTTVGLVGELYVRISRPPARSKLV